MYPSFWQILIVLLILLLLFGHKRVRDFGKALGESLRDFKKGLEGEAEEKPPNSVSHSTVNNSTVNNSEMKKSEMKKAESPPKSGLENKGNNGSNK